MVTLNEEQESKFQTWYDGWAEKSGIDKNPDDPKHQYDYRAAYENNAPPSIQDDGNYHWDSPYKGDWHPTRFIRNKEDKIYDTRNGRIVENEAEDQEYITWQQHQPEEDQIKANVIADELPPGVKVVEDNLPEGVEIVDNQKPTLDTPNPLYRVDPIKYEDNPVDKREGPNYWRNTWDEMSNVGTQVGGFVADIGTGIVDLPLIGRELGRAYYNVLRPAQQRQELISNPKLREEENKKQVQWVQKMREVGDKGRKSQTDQLSRVLKQGGVPAAIATQLGNTLWKTSFNLLLIKGISGAVPGGLTGPGRGWQETLKQAAKIAAMKYVTTPGNPDEKAKSAGISFMYMATPAISANVQLSDPLVKTFDFLLNTGISLTTGAYKNALSEAKGFAEENGEDWSDNRVKAKYLAVTATPVAVTDAYFSARTRSNRADITGGDPRIVKMIQQVEKLRFDATKNALNRERINSRESLVKALNESGEGRFRVVDQNRPLEATAVLSADKVGDVSIREGSFGKQKTYDVYKLATTGGRQGESLARSSGSLLGGESERVSNLRNQGLLTDNMADPLPGARPMELRVLKREDPEVAKFEIRAEAETEEGFTKVQELHNKLVADGKINESVEDLTKEQMLEQINEVIDKPDAGLPKTDSALKYSDLPKDIANLKRNADLFEEKIGVEGVESEKKQHFVKKLRDVADYLGTRNYTPESINANIDNLASRSFASIEDMSREELSSRLHDSLGNHQAVKDALQNKFELEDGFSMKDVPTELLSSLARDLPEVDIIGIDKTTADVIKSLYWAEDAEAGIKAANDLLANNGNAPFAAIDRSQLLTQSRHEYSLSPNERKAIVDMTPTKFKEKPGGMQALNEIMGQIRRPLPNPNTDPKSFERARRRIMQLAIARRRRTQEGRDGGNTFFSKLFDKALAFSSMRYTFHGLSVATGDFEFSRQYQDFNRNSKRANFYVEERLKGIFPFKGEEITDEGFRKNGQPVELIKKGRNSLNSMKWRNYIETHPELERAMITVIGTDRDTSVETPEGQALAESRALLGLKLAPSQKAYVDSLSDKIVPDKNAKELKFITNKIGDELQGASADNLRYLQVRKFMDFWDRNGEEILSLEARKESGTLGKQKIDRLETLTKEQQSISPWFKEEGKKGPSVVPRETLIDGGRIFQKGGREALREWVRGQEWGTRRNYWVTDRDYLSTLDPDVGEIVPGFKTEQAMKRLKITGSVNHRTGISVLQDERLFDTLYRITRQREVQASTYDSGREIINLLNKHGQSVEKGNQMIPDWTKTGIETYINNEWGKITRIPDPMIDLVRRYNRTWWTLYPLSITRAAWYTGRNLMFQGAPWGPIHTQYKALDVGEAYAKILPQMRNPNSRVRTFMNDVFKRDVSQWTELINQQFRSLAPGEADKSLFPKFEESKTFYYMRSWAKNFSSRILGFSDELNRMNISVPGYIIADKWVNRFVSDSNFTSGDLQEKLKMETLHPVQQEMLLDMLHDGIRKGGTREAFEPFTREITLLKNENINYVYALGGRSPVEQQPGSRLLVGIATYARGTADRFFRQGIAPLVRIMESLANGDAKPMMSKDFWSAMGNIGTQVFVHSLTAALASYMIGEKKKPFTGPQEQKTVPTFSLARSLTYSPFAPGLKNMEKFYEESNKFFGAVMTWDTEQVMNRTEVLLDMGVYFLPIMNDIATWAESVGNTTGATNAKYLLNQMDKKGYWTDRDIRESVIHGITGANELPDERSFGERFIDATIFTF